MAWWCISSDSIHEMLNRVAAGEDPWIVYAEFYANSEHEEVPSGEGEEETT